MKKFIVCLLSLVLVISSLAGCASNAKSSSTKGGYTFTVGITGDIAGLDPAVSYDPSTSVVVSQIAEALLTYDNNDKLIPNIASKWVTTDNKVFVYTIRDDVTFSDGTPLTVDDVVFSLKRIADPDGGAYMQWMYSSVDSIEKTGDHEVTVKLKAPSNSWQYVLASSAGYIISKAYYEKHSDDFGTSTGGILGSGAYVYDSWTSGQEIVLKKNTKYWNGNLKGAPDEIDYKIIADDTTLVTALKTGEVDFTTSPPLELLSELQNEANLSVNNFPGFGVTFLAFNTQRAPFNDLNVRKAVYHALDLNSLQKNIIGNSGSPATVLPQSEALYGTYPDQWKDYVAGAPVYEFNLDKAKEFLAKSAYPDGFSATVVVNESSRYNDIALFLQESLKPLNIDIKIVKVSNEEHDNYYFGSVLDADGHRDYDILVGSWWADFSDVGGVIEPIYQPGVTNIADYSNTEVQALIAEEAPLLDEKERNAKLFEALDIITDEIPYIFVQYPNSQNVLNKKYSGLKLDTAISAGNSLFKNVRAN